MKFDNIFIHESFFNVSIRNIFLSPLAILRRQMMALAYVHNLRKRTNSRKYWLVTYSLYQVDTCNILRDRVSPEVVPVKRKHETNAMLN